MISTILLLSCLINSPIVADIDGRIVSEKTTIYLTIDDDLRLSAKEEVFWVQYKPVLKEYDNLSNGTPNIVNIDYEIIPLYSNPSKSIEKNLNTGTHYIGYSQNPIPQNFSTNRPLHLIRDSIIQVVVREEDTYVGFLTELLGLPFIIPPMMTGEYGHQTDLRVGADCAELAIYGMRRMGFDIPYGGPGGILDYLTETDIIEKGTVIHFGYQVSVLYEDNGTKGVLDKDDLLIHAFNDGVKIEKLGDTELVFREYTLYKWKLNYKTERDSE